jgi:putative membrane protein
MNDELNHNKAAGQADIGTRLAYERTYLAHERTQMAWVRTSLTLISFGFAIDEFFRFLHERHPEHPPLLRAHTVGVLMIAIGVGTLVLADIQHRRGLKVLRDRCPGLPVSMAWLTALLLTLLGVLALVGALVRWG